MTNEQEQAVNWIVKGLESAKQHGIKVVCSVDISTCDEDSCARVFGDFAEINSLPSDVGAGSNEIQLLFIGSLND